MSLYIHVRTGALYRLILVARNSQNVRHAVYSQIKASVDGCR